MWSAIGKAFSQPSLRSATVGTLVLMACFLSLPLIDPTHVPRRPMMWAGVLSFIVVLLPIYPTYRLVTGRLSLSGWARRFFWATIFPWALIIGHFSSYAPDYLPLFFILFVGGGGVGVGIMPLWSYVTNTAWMIVCFLASCALLRPGYLETMSPALWLSLPIAMQGAYWIGLISRYYVGRNENTAQLLRYSRRDKRLVAEERQKSERLLLNILPVSVADELKKNGVSQPVFFPNATVLFTDFEGFTKIAESMQPVDLVRELDQCFTYFDSIVDRNNLEKLKTIGDSYMCAGGVPVRNRTHAIDCTLAALEIQAFMDRLKQAKKIKNEPYWELRLGIHTGPLVAGVIGEKKFAYDVWGDTVNTASRCESSGEAGRINVSQAVYEQIEIFFTCSYRGRIPAKHKGEIEMYFVEGIKPSLSVGENGLVPNNLFRSQYEQL